MTRRWAVSTGAVLLALITLYVAWWATLCNDCGPIELLYPWRLFGI